MSNHSRVFCGIIFFILTGCAEAGLNKNSAVFKVHDLDAFTIQIPDTWQSIDSTEFESSSKKWRKEYLFLNTQSKEPDIRESVLIMVAKFDIVPSYADMEKILLPNMREGQDQIRVISSNDTIIGNHKIRLIETSARVKEGNFRLVENFALYSGADKLMLLAWTSINHPGSINNKNKKLFMSIVKSIEWK